MSTQAISLFLQKNFAIYIIGAVTLIELVWIIFLQVNLRRIKKKRLGDELGENGAKIENELSKHSKLLRSLDKDIQELYNISNQVNNLSLRSLHKIAIVRFNPFKDLGGDQSFSIALLNGKNNGIVLSSLHTREGTRIYAKAIDEGKSEKHPLTEEEKQAVKKAISSEVKSV